jgi:hypothetical protein
MQQEELVEAMAESAHNAWWQTVEIVLLVPE